MSFEVISPFSLGSSLSDDFYFQRLLYREMIRRPDLPSCVSQGGMSLETYLSIAKKWVSADLEGIQHLARLRGLEHWHLNPQQRVKDSSSASERDVPFVLKTINGDPKDLEKHVNQSFCGCVEYLWAKMGDQLQRSSILDFGEGGLTRVVLSRDKLSLRRRDGQELETISTFTKEREKIKDPAVKKLIYHQSVKKSTLENFPLVLRGSYHYQTNLPLGFEIVYQHDLHLGDRLQVVAEMFYNVNGLAKEMKMEGWSCERGRDYYTRISRSPDLIRFMLKYKFRPERGILSLESATVDDAFKPNLNYLGVIKIDLQRGDLNIPLKVYKNTFTFQVLPLLDHYSFIKAIFEEMPKM